MLDSEIVLRKCEKVLDNHHQTMPLWSHPKSEALYGALSVYDGITFAQLFKGEERRSAAGMQKYKAIQDAVSQAINWLFKDADRIKSTPDPKVIDMAYEFVFHAERYVDIADFYKMYGRGLVDITAESEAIIRFDVTKPNQFCESVGWMESTSHQNRLTKKHLQTMNKDDANNIWSCIAKTSFHLNGGRIVIDKLPRDISERLYDFTKSMFKNELVPLDASCDLVGFSFGEFKKFMIYIASWSHIAFTLYCQSAINRAPQNQCMPVQIVNLGDFISSVSKATDLTPHVVDRIIQRLSYSTSGNNDFLLTPFLLLGENIAWSPAHVISYRPQRNMLKLMARGKKILKDHSSLITGSQDRPLTMMIAQHLNTKGYQYKLNQKLSFCDKETEVDILAYHTNKPNEVLLIEVKALLTPDEVNEVDHATKALQYAQGQLSTAIDILRSLPVKQKSKIFKFVDWNRVQNYFPVAISTDSEPSSAYDHEIVPAIAFTTFKANLKSRDLRSPSRIWSICRERPWFKSNFPIAKNGHNSIQVGSVTFMIPWIQYESDLEAELKQA